MQHQLLLSVVWILAVSANAIGASATQPATRPASLSSELKPIFRANSVERSLLPLLSAVLSEFPKNRDLANERLEKLVQLLNEGVKPGELESSVLSATTIEFSPFVDNRGEGSKVGKDWSYGTADERLNLISLMLERSAAFNEGEAAQRTKWLRAAILLASEDESANGFLAERLIGQEKVQQQLQLTAEEMKDLAIVADRRSKALSDSIAKRQAAMKLIWELSAREEAIAPDSLESCLLSLEIAKAPAITSEQQYRLCRIAWRLLNLTRHRKDVQLQRRVEQWIGQWKNEVGNVNTARWLSESLITSGPPPISAK